MYFPLSGALQRTVLMTMDSIDEDQPHDVLSSDTENATQIDPADAPPHKRRKYENFRKYNTGMWNGPERENTEQFNRQDDLHRYDSVASALGLTDYQQSRGRKIVDDFDANGIPIDKVIFAACVVVVNADYPDGTRYWPRPDLDDHGDETFEEMGEDLGFSKKEQFSMVQKVKSKVTT